MARDDGAEAKVAAAVAVTAVVFSPRARGLLRRGAVHGLASVLTAADALAAFARGVSRGARSATGGTPAPDAETGTADAAATARRGAEVSDG